MYQSHISSNRIIPWSCVLGLICDIDREFPKRDFRQGRAAMTLLESYGEGSLAICVQQSLLDLRPTMPLYQPSNFAVPVLSQFSPKGKIAAVTGVAKEIGELS
jgi:hypothetical protein